MRKELITNPKVISKPLDEGLDTITQGLPFYIPSLTVTRGVARIARLKCRAFMPGTVYK
jgi:hypothetical protein